MHGLVRWTYSLAISECGYRLLRLEPYCLNRGDLDLVLNSSRVKPIDSGYLPTFQWIPSWIVSDTIANSALISAHHLLRAALRGCSCRQSARVPSCCPARASYLEDVESISRHRPICCVLPNATAILAQTRSEEQGREAKTTGRQMGFCNPMHLCD